MGAVELGKTQKRFKYLLGNVSGHGVRVGFAHRVKKISPGLRTGA